MYLSSIKKKLGDILVDVGIISQEQLKEALEIQKRTGAKLGMILSQKGLINEEAMFAFLGKQCGVPYISLQEYGEIPENIIHSVPERVIKQQNLIPIALKEKVLTIAMSDPFNIFAIDDVVLMTGYDLEVVITSESEIKSAIKKYLSHYSTLDEILPADISIESLKNDSIFNSFIQHAIRLNASYIYIETFYENTRIKYKIDGLFQEQSFNNKKIIDTIILYIKELAGNDNSRSHNVYYRQINIDNNLIKLKISMISTVSGERIILQLLTSNIFPDNINSLGIDLEVLPLYKRMVELPRGMVLVTGPAKSGKTTTLYNTLKTFDSSDKDIVTIEDPVEFILPELNQVQIDADSNYLFKSIFDVVIGQNPDVVMVGEIKDKLSANEILNASLNRCAMFSSITSNSSADAVTMLLCMGVAPILIASSLNIIVNQRLIRMICPHCKESYDVKISSLKNLGLDKFINLRHSNKITLSKSKGCAKCNFSGYLGQTGVFEILELNDELRNLIIEKAPYTVLLENFSKNIKCSIKQSLFTKILSGVTTIEEYLRINRL